MKRNIIKNLRFDEILVLTLGKIFNKILSKFQYQDKYLPLKKEIESLLRDNLQVSRNKRNILITYQTGCLKQKFLIRPCTSDKLVFYQILIKAEYSPILELINKKNDLIRIIVDAGSNIGLTSIYFNNFLPVTKIISIEPDTSNYLLQLRNIKINNLQDKVLVINKALWINNTDNLIVSNDFRDGGNWSKTMKLSQKNELNSVQPITLIDIINDYSPYHVIDLLKIDIEGSEKNLFESDDFIRTISQRVKYLCLEIHDELKIRSKIKNILNDINFEFFEVRETTFCYNKNVIV